MLKYISTAATFALYGSVAYQSVVYNYDHEKSKNLELPNYSDYMQKVQPLISDGEVRGDLIVYEDSAQVFGQAKGTSMFGGSDVVVEMTPGFFEKDEEAATFVMYHEVKHVIANDPFFINAVGLVMGASASLYIVPSNMGPLQFFLPVAVHTVSVIANGALKIPFSQWREGIADDFAIEKSTPEELLGGRRFFKVVQQINLDGEQTYPELMPVPSIGGVRMDFIHPYLVQVQSLHNIVYKFDLMHPSLASRIVKIENALVSRNITINEEEQALKIARLRSVWL